MNLKFGYFSSIGQKAKQEDRLVCIPDMTSIPGLVEFSILPDKRLSYFAVFDGHGGAKCSTFLSQNFHMELGRHKKIVTQPITALRETWKGMDKIYYDHCLRQASGDESAVSCDGSTATVVLVVGDDMYILNCGDSAGGVISSEGTIEILTEDHGTHNSVEATRVVANGGVLRDQGIKFYKPFPLCCFAASQQAKLRLYPGGLLVTRAFGDFNAKVAILGGIAGVVIHDHGEVRHKKLDSGIRSIILASDGLWDGLSKIQIENILRGRSTPPLSECRIDIDREMDTSVFRGFDTEMDDSTVAQAFAIGKDAVNSLAWQKLGAKLLRAVINASLINDF